MRRFHLDRKMDISGVSGLGVVAEGIEFSTGQCVICWIATEVHSLEFYDSVKNIEKIHGHEGATKVVWEDNEG